MSDEPFSHAVVATDVPAAGRDYHFEADEAERRALAERMGIPAVEKVAVDLRVRPVRGQSYHVRGTVKAAVVQTCVVSLEPFPQELAEEIDVTLMPAESSDRRHRGGEEVVDALADDSAEIFANGRIDLGVIAAEHLALGLDPYPHAPGVNFPGHLEDEAEPGPFAALAKLKETPGR